MLAIIICYMFMQIILSSDAETADGEKMYCWYVEMLNSLSNTYHPGKPHV